MQPACFETDRLSFRPHRLEDFEDTVALWSDPVVTRYVGGQPLTREDVWSRLLRHAGLWYFLGFGYWAVRARDSGRFVGQVGFADYRRDILPGLGDQPEMGWMLAPWAHGQGFGREAVEGALAWADRAWGTRNTVCFIQDGNLPSLRLAQKVGFRETGRSTYHGKPVILLARRGGVGTVPDAAPAPAPVE